MNQNIFEIRQRAKELVEQAIAMWHNTSQSEQLEGLEKDPVFSMLISAIAYQNNETENEIARINDEVIREFVQTLAPYEMGHPLPATIALQVGLEPGCPEWDVDSNTIGWTSDMTFSFMPLVRSRILNVKVGSILRLDGRRWKVRLDFDAPVKDLSRFSFAIQDSHFTDLTITCNKYELPLVRPWQYAELPLTRCFSLDCSLYNNSQYFNASMIGMELFARQNLRMFCIKDHNSRKYIKDEVESLELIFEFSGITEDFIFDYSQLITNCMVMIEAQMNYATLSNERPIVRLAGYSNNASEEEPQFLHLIRPDEDQLFGDLNIHLRRASADRFNRASLIRLLSSLINKYHSDFYAFQQIEELANDHTMETLQDILQQLISAALHDNGAVGGVYAMLNHDNLRTNRVSVDLPYLTTHGAAVNNLLSTEMNLSLPSSFDKSVTHLIAPPVQGFNEMSDLNTEESLMRYRIVTNNRLVTPADIKLFCYTELKTRYGIDNKLVESISVTPHPTEYDHQGPGYEILVTIKLRENNFIKRSFEERITTAELLMQKMMEVRSAMVYPLRVNITIEASKL